MNSFLGAGFLQDFLNTMPSWYTMYRMTKTWKMRIPEALPKVLYPVLISSYIFATRALTHPQADLSCEF